MRRVLAACAAIVLVLPTQPANAAGPLARAHAAPRARVLTVLSGIVVDSDGNPLRNALVSGYALHIGAELMPVRTTAHGRFRLPVQASDTYVVDTTGRRASGGNSDATGYAERDRVISIGQDGVHGLRITLAAGGAIRGTVTDLAGHPLAGVGMSATLPSPYLEPNAGNFGGFAYYTEPSTRTDAHGHYLIRGLDDFARTACANPWHASGGNADATGYSQRCEPNAIAVAPQHIATAPTLALQPRVDGALTGTITGPNGKPERNAGLSIYPQSASFDYLGFASTDATGHFTKIDIPLGKAQVCAYGTIDPGLGLRSKCRTVTVTPGAATRASLRLTHGGAVSGRLRSPSGAPVVGTPVSVTRTKAKFGVTSTGYTDARGNYSVGGLDSGRYRVCFDSDQTPAGPGATGVAPTCLNHSVTIIAGRDHAGADRVLRLGGAVAGTVTDSSGHPLPAIGLRFRRVHGHGSVGSGNTAADGTYLAKNLPPGTYTPCAVEPRLFSSNRRVCLSHAITVTRGNTVRGVDLSFPTLTQIHVRVTDPNGHPLSGVEVAALRACVPNGLPCAPEHVFGRQDVSTTAIMMTDDTGSADLTHLRPGSYAVCALAYYAASPLGSPKTGYADRCTGSTFTVTVTQGSTTPVAIQLVHAGTITGRVIDQSGHGVRGATMHVTGSAYDDVDHESFYDYTGLDGLPSPFTDQRTDARGHYSIHSVQPGRSPVCARNAPGHRGGCSSSHVTITGTAVTHVPTIDLHRRSGAARTQASQQRPARLPVLFVDGHPVVLRYHP